MRLLLLLLLSALHLYAQQSWDALRQLKPGVRVRVLEIVGATVDQTLGAYFRNESGETSGARAVTYVAPTALFGGIAAAMGSWQTVYKR